MAKLDWPCCMYGRTRLGLASPVCSYWSQHLVILQMRLYALYSLNKKVLVLMISMFIISSASSAAIMGMALSGFISESVMASNKFWNMTVPDVSSHCPPPPRNNNLCSCWLPNILLHNLDPNHCIWDPPMRFAILPWLPNIPCLGLQCLPTSTTALRYSHPGFYYLLCCVSCLSLLCSPWPYYAACSQYISLSWSSVLPPSLYVVPPLIAAEMINPL